MKITILSFVLLLSPLAFSQDFKYQNNNHLLYSQCIPVNLKESLIHVQEYIPDSIHLSLLNSNEEDFTQNALNQLQLVKRDLWWLSGQSKLARCFNKKHIYHPNSIYHIILTSYYRQYHQKPIKIKQQFRHHKLNNIKYSTVDFTAYLIDQKPYIENIDKALLIQDRIDYISLTACDYIPEKLLQFSKLKDLNIGLSPKLDFKQAFKKLSKLDSLEALWLDENGFSEIPNSIKKLTYLKSLWIDIENISTLPKSIRSLKQLEEIIINECYNLDFDQFIKQITPLPKLKNLDIGFNDLNEIPSTIGDLKLLQELSLYGNKLHRIPNEIHTLPNLKKLSISDNNIDTIIIFPNDFHKLTELHFSSNNLQMFPINLHKIKNLKILSINSNPNMRIPKNMELMNKLVKLNLKYCSLSEADKIYLIRALPNTNIEF